MAAYIALFAGCDTADVFKASGLAWPISLKGHHLRPSKPLRCGQRGKPGRLRRRLEQQTRRVVGREAPYAAMASHR